MTARAISWDDLTAGVWTPHYTRRPCMPGLIDVSRRWPAWRTGTPPTWAEFVAAREIHVGDRGWLVAHVLLANRRRLVAWAADCAELAVDRVGSHEAAAICAEVITPLRAWATGDNSISLRAVNDRAWQIRANTTFPTAAAFAATTAAATAVADDDNAADSAVAVAVTVAADCALGLALPYLVGAGEDRP